MTMQLFSFGHPCEHQLRRACIGGSSCPLNGYPDAWCCSFIKGKINFKRDKPCEGPRCRWGFTHPSQSQFDAVTQVLTEARPIATLIDESEDKDLLTFQIDSPHISDTVQCAIYMMRHVPSACGRRVGQLLAYAAVKAGDLKLFTHLLKTMKKPVDSYILGAYAFLTSGNPPQPNAPAAAAAGGSNTNTNTHTGNGAGATAATGKGGKKGTAATAATAAHCKKEEIVEDLRNETVDLMNAALSQSGQLVDRDDQHLLQATFIQALRQYKKNNKKRHDMLESALSKFGNRQIPKELPPPPPPLPSSTAGTTGVGGKEEGGNRGDDVSGASTTAGHHPPPSAPGSDPTANASGPNTTTSVVGGELGPAAHGGGKETGAVDSSSMAPPGPTLPPPTPTTDGHWDGANGAGSTMMAVGSPYHLNANAHLNSSSTSSSNTSTGGATGAPTTTAAAALMASTIPHAAVTPIPQTAAAQRAVASARTPPHPTNASSRTSHTKNGGGGNSSSTSGGGASSTTAPVTASQRAAAGGAFHLTPKHTASASHGSTASLLHNAAHPTPNSSTTPSTTAAAGTALLSSTSSASSNSSFQVSGNTYQAAGSGSTSANSTHPATPLPSRGGATNLSSTSPLGHATTTSTTSAGALVDALSSGGSSSVAGTRSNASTHPTSSSAAATLSALLNKGGNGVATNAPASSPSTTSTPSLAGREAGAATNTGGGTASTVGGGKLTSSTSNESLVPNASGAATNIIHSSPSGAMALASLTSFSTNPSHTPTPPPTITSVVALNGVSKLGRKAVPRPLCYDPIAYHRPLQPMPLFFGGLFSLQGESDAPLGAAQHKTGGMAAAAPPPMASAVTAVPWGPVAAALPGPAPFSTAGAAVSSHSSTPPARPPMGVFRTTSPMMNPGVTAADNAWQTDIPSYVTFNTDQLLQDFEDV